MCRDHVENALCVCADPPVCSWRKKRYLLEHAEQAKILFIQPLQGLQLCDVSTAEVVLHMDF